MIVALLLVVGVYIAQPYFDRLCFGVDLAHGQPRGALADIERTSIELFERASPWVTPVVGARAGALDAAQSEGETAAAQSGTGFLWDEAGDIVTNDHVVAGTGELAVRLSSGTVARADIVGQRRTMTSPSSGFAIQARSLHQLPWADRRTSKSANSPMRLAIHSAWSRP